MIKKSNNKASKKNFTKGTKGVSGPNMTSGPYGNDPYGDEFYISIEHFKNVEQPNINH